MISGIILMFMSRCRSRSVRGIAAPSRLPPRGLLCPHHRPQCLSGASREPLQGHGSRRCAAASAARGVAGGDAARRPQHVLTAAARCDPRLPPLPPQPLTRGAAPLQCSAGTAKSPTVASRQRRAAHLAAQRSALQPLLRQLHLSTQRNALAPPHTPRPHPAPIRSRRCRARGRRGAVPRAARGRAAAGGAAARQCSG